MKTPSFILGLLLLAVTPLFSAETTTPPAPAQTPAPALSIKRDYKDAFLSFALEKAEKYSGAAEQAVNKAVDAATTEAPLLAREFIVWHAWEHGISFLTPLFLFITSLVLFCNQWGKWELDYHENLTKGKTGNVVATVVGAAGALITGVITLCCVSHLLSFIQVLVAPRVYIVEQVLNLIQK